MLVLYEDLNCPFCYALTTFLQEEGLAELIGWRGIEHAPGVPSPWRAPSETLRSVIESEVAMVLSRCPNLSLKAPYGQPNTAQAILAVTDAFQRSPRLGTELRASLKHALFVDDVDISDSEVIDDHRERLGLAPLVVTPELQAECAGWQAEWTTMNPRVIPTLVQPDGVIRPGLGVPTETLAFVREYYEHKR